MEIKFDTKADALYIRLKKEKVYRTMSTKDNYLIDLDKKGNVIGIEILNYSKIAKKECDAVSFSVLGSKSKLSGPLNFCLTSTGLCSSMYASL